MKRDIFTQALRVDSEAAIRPGTQRLLDVAASLLCEAPALATELSDGSFRLSVPLPAGYERKLNKHATRLTARITRQGWLFEIAEAGQGSSGGWMASCIPPGLYQTFLSAWVQMAGTPAQGELFPQGAQERQLYGRAA